MKGRRVKRTEHVRLDRFAARLWSEWRRLELPVSKEAIVVAVSGGADSTALLSGISELSKSRKLDLTVFVAHLDHGLRAASRKDSRVVAEMAKRLDFQAIRGRTDVMELAHETGDNLEQAARRARYSFLEKTARRKKARFILVAHTMDDQAETVLLRLVRGSSSDGLSGMAPVRPLSPGSQICLVRPLLSWARRSDTESYCREQGFEFINDEMNMNENFARVRVRQHLLPLLQSFNNRIVETLNRTSGLLREDSVSLGIEAAALLERATIRNDKRAETDHPLLNVRILAGAPAAVRRRALRQWLSEGRGDLRRIEQAHLLSVERLLEGDKGGRVAELPNGTKVRRKQTQLELLVKKG